MPCHLKDGPDLPLSIRCNNFPGRPLPRRELFVDCTPEPSRHWPPTWPKTRFYLLPMASVRKLWPGQRTPKSQSCQRSQTGCQVHLEGVIIKYQGFWLGQIDWNLEYFSLDIDRFLSSLDFHTFSLRQDFLTESVFQVSWLLSGPR